jgi:perosamine synthetase
MPDMDELCSIAERYGIPFVEDAAEAIGSIYKDVKAGKFGIGSVFSFHRTKTLTTGEGGMLLVDSDELYERCKFLRDHGRSGKIAWYFTEVAYKYMPFNVQAALGYGQFKRLAELVMRKREIFHMYTERLQNIEDIQLNPEPAYVFNSYWATTIVFGKSHKLTKEGAMELLAQRGIPSRPFFYPLSSLPAFPGYEEKCRSSNPYAYDISSRGINLPSAMNLTASQIDRVCGGLKMILTRKAKSAVA